MWENILKAERLQTGDVIETSSRTLMFKHYGVIFYKNGIAYVTHCVREGVKIEPLSEFEKQRTIYNFFRNEVTKKLTDEFIEKKANELSAYGYNFIESNCEDYAKRIVGTYIGMDDRVTFIIIISIVIITALTATIFFILKRR